MKRYTVAEKREILDHFEKAHDNNEVKNLQDFINKQDQYLSDMNEEILPVKYNTVYKWIKRKNDLEGYGHLLGKPVAKGGGRKSKTDPDNDPETDPDFDPVDEPETDPETDPVDEGDNDPDNDPETDPSSKKSSKGGFAMQLREKIRNLERAQEPETDPETDPVEEPEGDLVDERSFWQKYGKTIVLVVSLLSGVVSIYIGVKKIMGGMNNGQTEEGETEETTEEGKSIQELQEEFEEGINTV